MDVRVKGLTHGFYLRDAQLLERRVELCHYHLNALAVGLVGGGLSQRPLKIVVYRKELQQSVGLYIGVQRLALLLAALAVVIVLGAQAQILFLFRADKLFGRFLYLGLLFGFLLRLFFLLGVGFFLDLLFGLFFRFFFGLFFIYLFCGGLFLSAHL